MYKKTLKNSCLIDLPAGITKNKLDYEMNHFAFSWSRIMSHCSSITDTLLHSLGRVQGVNALSMAYQPTCVLPKSLPSADPTAFSSSHIWLSRTLSEGHTRHIFTFTHYLILISGISLMISLFSSGPWVVVKFTISWAVEWTVTLEELLCSVAPAAV